MIPHTNYDCYSIDALHSLGMARLVNDATGAAVNCAMKVIVHEATPHLCLFSTRSIACGEELRYDYGGLNCPWRMESMF